MKKINNRNKISLLKKIFIKICRIFGFEIIDQSNFNSPTLRKNLDDTLSIQGKKSITIPMGQINIKKKVRSLKIIVRTCTSELIMDQNKRRIFDCEKNEYTFRTLRSLIRATNKAKEKLKNTLIFDLPAGKTCPMANECWSYVVMNDNGNDTLPAQTQDTEDDNPLNM